MAGQVIGASRRVGRMVAVACALFAMLGSLRVANAQAPSQTTSPAAIPELAAPGSEKPAHYRRLSLTANALYMLIPIFELSAELALNPRWSIGVRGGVGQADEVDEPRTIWEVGAQGFYSFTGNVDKGFRVGLEGRVNHYEGDGQLLGLGDGAAIGPMIGYKWAGQSGMTVSIYVGPELVLANEETDLPEEEESGRALAYLYLGGGWSVLPNRELEPGEQHERLPPPPLDPFDYHDGFAGGFFLGGGLPVLPECDECGFRPGIGLGAYLSYFISRRFALMVDSNAVVTVLSSGLGAMGVGAHVLAVQYWPHEDFWLKAGAGVTQVAASALVVFAADIGGGGTVAGGYVLHRNRNFYLDTQLRANHASFDGLEGESYAVDWFVAQLGLNWN